VPGLSRLILIACSLVALLTGCVERELVIETSEPAEVFVDGERIGISTADAPARIAFDDYGTRRVTARAAGFVPAQRAVELAVPWYQVFPLGFFSDVLWPGTIHDEHRVRLTLTRRGEPRPADTVAREAKAFAEPESETHE
jgi:hypothetical protein